MSLKYEPSSEPIHISVTPHCTIKTTYAGLVVFRLPRRVGHTDHILLEHSQL